MDILETDYRLKLTVSVRPI